MELVDEVEPKAVFGRREEGVDAIAVDDVLHEFIPTRVVRERDGERGRGLLMADLTMMLLM
jgi:hypothetical protein